MSQSDIDKKLNSIFSKVMMAMLAREEVASFEIQKDKIPPVGYRFMVSDVNNRWICLIFSTIELIMANFDISDYIIKTFESKITDALKGEENVSEK